MPLTFRTNGSGSPSLVGAAWWNDFYNLFTGAMTDQLITFKPNVTHQAISAPPAAPTVVTAAGSNLGIGVYKYAVTFVGSDSGETLISSLASLTTTSGNAAASLSVIPIGPTGTTSRKLYRSKVGATTMFFLATIADNTTTTYSDSATDASLSTTQAPSHSTFGGSIFIKDATGATKMTISSDGYFIGSGLNNIRNTLGQPSGGTEIGKYTLVGNAYTSTAIIHLYMPSLSRGSTPLSVTIDATDLLNTCNTPTGTSFTSSGFRIYATCTASTSANFGCGGNWTLQY